MIKIENLLFAYPNHSPVFENLSLSFECGERVCIKAPSGRGKTTLLRLIAGLEKPQSGKITFDRKRKISFVFQNGGLLDWYSALKNVSLVCSKEKAREVLALFQMEESLEKMSKQLSGGMKKRVLLARAVCFEPDILLIDEGFASFDDELKKTIFEFLKSEFSNRLIIFTSHDESEIELFATRVVTL